MESGDYVNRKTSFVIGILFTEYLGDHGYSAVTGVLQLWSIGVLVRFGNHSNCLSSATPLLHCSKGGEEIIESNPTGLHNLRNCFVTRVRME